jgi:hypothetical protein
VRDEVPFAVLIGFVTPGDEVNSDSPTAGELIERGGHPSEYDWLNETRSLRDHYFETLRTVQYGARYSPTLRRHGAVANEHAIKSRLFVRS